MTVARSVLWLAGWILLSFAAGVLGSQFTPGGWYAALAKPAWNPPDWIFGPVWTALYTMMGCAAWLVWRQGGFAQQRTALLLFLGQLLLNAAWSWLFFGLHRPGIALVEIIVLWGTVLLTLVKFARVSPGAAWLLAPYLAWLSFAAALNFALWQLNPG
jgi:tryptophan-rich sensory protein